MLLLILEYKKVVLISYLAHREGLPTTDGEIRELSCAWSNGTNIDTNANADTRTIGCSAGVQCDRIGCVGRRVERVACGDDSGVEEKEERVKKHEIATTDYTD